MEDLKKDIYFLNVSELKEICRRLRLLANGPKKELINRILLFIDTGEIFKALPMLEVSKAKYRISYTLSPDTLILYGSYKNDLATRMFMKTLVGDHFHFTAFGQDWIRDRWDQGKPPTYAEFAEFWRQEYKSRKYGKAKPKQEWAYLNFIQQHIKKSPNAKRIQIMESWKKTRAEKVQKVQKIIDQHMKNMEIKI